MRMSVILPKVKPDVYDYPDTCPHEECDGHTFQPHGTKGEIKLIRDVEHRQVRAYRVRCLKCGRTFRVYPQGVSHDQQSDRLKGLSVLLYVLGLSYGAVEDTLAALGAAIARSTVYGNVQDAGVVSREIRKRKLATGQKRERIGADATYVNVKGTMTGVQVVLDDETGELLGLTIEDSENYADVLQAVQEVSEAVNAEVIVSDDLNAYKKVADMLGLDHQICRNHVKRNVEELATALTEQLQEAGSPPEGTDLSHSQVIADLEQLGQLVRERPKDGDDQLGAMYERYKGVVQPPVGQHHSVWYRMRMLITRLWDRWSRLTLDLRRGGMDGTNNAAERLIGWFIKERYRTMRGYKRTESVLNVVSVTAQMGVCPGSYDMSELYA